MLFGFPSNSGRCEEPAEELPEPTGIAGPAISALEGDANTAPVCPTSVDTPTHNKIAPIIGVSLGCIELYFVCLPRWYLFVMDGWGLFSKDGCGLRNVLIWRLLCITVVIRLH
jgi:hypothetical protein